MTHPATKTGVGRPYPTDTPLGRLMAYKGLRSYDLCAAVGIPPRTLTEILAGRRKISRKHMASLCQYLKCEPHHLEPQE